MPSLYWELERAEVSAFIGSSREDIAEV